MWSQCTWWPWVRSNQDSLWLIINPATNRCSTKNFNQRKKDDLCRNIYPHFCIMHWRTRKWFSIDMYFVYIFIIVHHAAKWSNEGRLKHLPIWYGYLVGRFIYVKDTIKTLRKLKRHDGIDKRPGMRRKNKKNTFYVFSTNSNVIKKNSSTGCLAKSCTNNYNQNKIYSQQKLRTVAYPCGPNVV